MKPATTIIELRADGDDPRPMEVRERLALKALLRRFGLVCVNIRDIEPTTGPKPPEAPNEPE